MLKPLATLFLLLADYLLFVLAAAFTIAAVETLCEKYKRYKALKASAKTTD